MKLSWLSKFIVVLISLYPIADTKISYFCLLRFVMEKFPFISDAAPKSFSMKTILASIIGSLVSISKIVPRNLKSWAKEMPSNKNSR